MRAGKIPDSIDGEQRWRDRKSPFASLRPEYTKLICTVGPWMRRIQCLKLLRRERQ
jgi:hypothetical protein